MNRWTRKVLLFFLLLIVAGCAAAPKPLEGLVPGKEMETLQSAVSVTIRHGDESRGARGYLVFKRPDRFHLALLSPFGQSLLDVYSSGDSFVALVPGKQVAYRGAVADLPDREGVRLWGLMRWVVEPLPAAVQSAPAVVDRVTADGRHEKVYVDGRGLVERKGAENGDEIVYRDYGNVDGVAFPGRIELSDREGMTVAITFSDPEINRPLDEEALTPNLVNVKVLPFSAFRGF